MSDDQDEDKQFEPTQKKLDDARKKGEIAKSMDLVTASIYAAMTITAIALGAVTSQSLASSLQSVLEHSNEISKSIFEGSPQSFFLVFLTSIVNAIAIWFVIPILAAILCLLGQQAIIVAPTKIHFKASRISLLSGAKNKFGRQGLFEFFKSFVKLLIYGTVLGIYLAAQSERLLGTIFLSPSAIVIELSQLLVGLLLIVVIVATSLGIVDFVWQKSEHTRKNRMSRKEIMDEMKQSEGDPMIKQKRRQRGHEIVMNRMMEDVPNADVIIVNPTHFSVALSWDRTPGSAPVCVAKGVDKIASKIRELAIENGIPIHSDPPTARAIFATVEIGDTIKQSQFGPVAAAIRFAERIKKEAVKKW